MKPHLDIFDEQHVLHALKHYLPTQSPLKDFIHHNSLHAFQHLKFYEAIFKAAKIFGFQATTPLEEFREMFANGRIKTEILDRAIVARQGDAHLNLWREKLLNQPYHEHSEARIGQLRALWKHQFGLDLENAVQPILFRLASQYLDQGIAIWPFPIRHLSFLDALRAIEQHSYVSLFKTKRARELLQLPEVSLKKLLHILVGNEAYYSQYLFDQQFSHRGWSGMVATVEQQPAVMLDRKNISLHDFILVELLLEIDCLEAKFGKNWHHLATEITVPPVDLFAELPESELMEVLKIWQDAFEWSYYDEILAGIQLSSQRLAKQQQLAQTPKTFQALFCIDERECSIRRHVETVDPHCETLGTPGFFSAEFFFLPQNGKFYEKLCPAPVTPKYLIKESAEDAHRPHDAFYTPKTHGLAAGFLSAFTFGFWALIRLIQHLFAPKMAPAISNAFAVMHDKSTLTVENASPKDQENGLQIGYTVDEMAARVLSLLNGIALKKDFAPLVYLIAHGSSSANNPHHGAHDCGACSGRPGAVNARVMATMANHPKVREKLKNAGIYIPPETQFIGGMHDTAADEMGFYDTHLLTAENAKLHANNIATFEKACDLNAKERSRRFASIETKSAIHIVRRAIKNRSVSLFEPRPELGHGTNALCIVGKRALTKSMFMDRRAFMNSYDYQNDLDGQVLANIMKPLGPVCGGINLEYYFSRVDNYKLGAGTKLPHNVVGLFGVANSSDGDLRPGLPWQMVEVHDPIRLMIIVEHFPEVVLKAIQSTPEMYEWFINEWVHLSVIHPESHALFYFKAGTFVPYAPVTKKLPAVESILDVIESAPPMQTNRLPDATKENLPVFLNE